METTASIKERLLKAETFEPWMEEAEQRDDRWTSDDDTDFDEHACARHEAAVKQGFVSRRQNLTKSWSSAALTMS